MINEIIPIVSDSLLDTLKMLPLVALTYVILDMYERNSSINNKLNAILNSKTGPLFGALIGCIPQCGFSFLAATLFTHAMISPGTLLAVFIATSDEALPIFLANPQEYRMLIAMILCKIIMAILGGYLLDFIIYLIHSARNKNQLENNQNSEEEDEDVELELQDPTCTCANSPWYNVFTKTLRIALFVFVLNLTLGGVIAVIGEDTLSSFLSSTYYFQPLLSALVGFIPNCAASIVLTELYMLGGLSFGALLSGLSVGAGIGMTVLFKDKENRSYHFALLLYLYLFSVACGYLVQLIF